MNAYMRKSVQSVALRLVVTVLLKRCTAITHSMSEAQMLSLRERESAEEFDPDILFQEESVLRGLQRIENLADALRPLTSGPKAASLQAQTKKHPTVH